MSDLDHQIRSSLERLTDPGATHHGDVWESTVARRRGRRHRRAAGVAVAAVALVPVLATAVGDLGHEPNDVVVATNPDDGGVEPRTGMSPISEVPTYDLNLPGAQLLRGESLTARNTDVVLWGDGHGAYLSLSVRPGEAGTYGAPSGLGPMARDFAVPEEAGVAWLSEPEDPRAATMWWVQPSGDLWILRAHWYGDIVPDDGHAALREWGLAIDVVSTTDGAPYRLDDERLSRIAFDAAGDRPSRSRVWSYKGQEVTLLVLDGSSSAAGLSNLLARGAPTLTDLPNLGQVWAVGSTFGWTVSGTTGAWATLLLPEDLAGESDAILRALAAE